ncbi:MAG: TIGR00725 family protein [Syntrophotaleaceae bacterium]
MQKLLIGVIGASRCTERGYAMAREVGRLLAAKGAVVVCGGLDGIMEAACRGCLEAGGETLGILPGGDPAAANPYVTLAVPTNMGHARNVIIAHTARALIAIEGEFGTLSEMAIGLKLGRPVIALGSWPGIDGVLQVSSPEEAVGQAFERLCQPERQL